MGDRTAFHRAGRNDLHKFMTRDVPTLHRYFSGLTTHRFELDELEMEHSCISCSATATHAASGLDLLTVHRAYFVFRNLRKNNGAKSVRILVFDAQQ